MPADAGMLIVFPESGRHAIWMKNCRFRLDLVSIRPETPVVFDVVDCSAAAALDPDGLLPGPCNRLPTFSSSALNPVARRTLIGERLQLSTPVCACPPGRPATSPRGTPLIGAPNLPACVPGIRGLGRAHFSRPAKATNCRTWTPACALPRFDPELRNQRFSLSPIQPLRWLRPR